MVKKIQRDPKSVALAQAILEQYQLETKDDVEDAIQKYWGNSIGNEFTEQDVWEQTRKIINEN